MSEINMDNDLYLSNQIRVGVEYFWKKRGRRPPAVCDYRLDEDFLDYADRELANYSPNNDKDKSTAKVRSDV